jgi:MFS family permease
VTPDSKYRWYLLMFTAFTFAIVITMPGASLAVLFEEIAADLHLNLVQIGMIWGIGSLLAIFTGSLCGALIDRFGPKRVLIAGILLVGLFNSLRGLAHDFSSLMILVLLVGGVVPMVSTSGFKINGVWFHRQLGTANSVLSMGMALGLVAGSLLAATTLSPALGGWRPTMYFFGALDLLAAGIWLFIDPLPPKRDAPEGAVTVPMHEALAHVLRLRDLWPLGLALFGIGACQQGMAGYLALYLRGIGWAGPTADTALSMVYAASLACILPIGFVSDRLRSRKWVLLAAIAVMAAGTGWLSAAGGAAIWVAVVVAGMMRDGSVAVVLTMAVETENVGPRYAGTATGFIMTFFFLGGLISPPIGNKLADLAPGAPFIFWAVMAAAGMISLWKIRPRHPAHPAAPSAVPRTGI